MAQRDLPGREAQDNKFRGGKLLVVAGSAGMRGAGILTATAAARSGAGYVYLYTSRKDLSPMRHPDFLECRSLQDLSKIAFSAAALGPGLSDLTQTQKWLRKLIQQGLAKVVLDAHALRVLAEGSQKGSSLPPTWILTPHEGEMAKLLKTTSTWVRLNRLQSIIEAQKRWKCVVLLKGHGTLVTDGRSVYKIKSGNPALAKAGTGDVLTGMIAAFLSQGLAPLKAAALGAFIHGKIADDWIASGEDILSLMAHDIVHRISPTLRSLRKKNRPFS